ncbi:hypothetical protein QQ045_010551 [Rhodiola kirilowii]
MSTSSTISSFMKRLASARCLNRQPKLLLLPTISDTRSYSARSYPRNNLFSRISPLGSPDIRVTPILDKWVEEGKKVRDMELKHIIRDLRKRRRFTQALEVSEWLSVRENFEVSDSDHAVQLDLIGRVHGIDAAKDIGVSPDCFSYRICINLYGVKSDIESMEKVVKEMEEDPYISMDWNTYANASTTS